MSKRNHEDTVTEEPNIPVSQPTTLENDPPAKYHHVDQNSGSTEPMEGKSITCALPPHRQILAFDSFPDYELHYRKVHENWCTECHKNFPMAHYLSLHIAENHDPINEARKARGEKIYACFVEDCDRICSAPAKRRLHSIDKHSFPPNYDFSIINKGLKGRRTLLRRNAKPGFSGEALPKDSHGRASISSSASQEGVDHFGPAQSPVDASRSSNDPLRTETRPEDSGSDMDSIVKSMSALKFVPNSIRFGRGKRSGGLARRNA